MMLTFSAVSPATSRQIGVFQRTSESSSDSPGFRVIAWTKAFTRRSIAARAASAVTSGSGEGDSVTAGAGAVCGSVFAMFEQHNATSTAMPKAAKQRPIDRLNMPASGFIFPVTEIA